MFDARGLLICVFIYVVGLLILGATITSGLFMVHVAVVPLLFKYSKTVRRSIVFANFVQWPPNVNFDDPSSRGIDGARNFTIEYESKVDKCNIKLGVWHILPKSVYNKTKDTLQTLDKEGVARIFDSELVNSKTPIVLYCHGNSNSRAATHRVDIYKVFQNLEFHTIAFDYRGYGDSTNKTPTEDGVVEDSLVVYDWLQSTTSKDGNRPPIFVWGHSLGTAISCHMLGNLEELSSGLLNRDTPLSLPKGLILEAPFNNLADEVAKHPLSKLVSWLPYYETTFVAPFRNSEEQNFKSDEHLSRVRSLPVLILHAKDDVIVPYVVGLQLYCTVKSSRSENDASIELHAYDRSDKLGHKWICKASDLSLTIGNFVKKNV